MSYDEVRIDPAVAAEGLQAWRATTEALQAAVAARTTAIRTAQDARPWGGDSGGPEFADAYLEGAGPSMDAMTGTATQLVQLGDSSDQAIQASLASDAVQATAVTVEVDSRL